MRILNQGGILLLMIAAPVVSYAQDQTAAPPSVPANVPACTQELVEKAEASFRRRIYRSETRFRAERELSAVVRLCAELPASYQAEENLKVVREELAEHDLAIALFYLERYRVTGRRRGALSRLRNIVERYPEYSKLDQVLSLRGQLSLAEEELTEAAACYERILKDFPASRYVGEALIQLRTIDDMRSDDQLER